MFIRSRRNLAGWFMLSMGSILIVFAGVRYYLTAIERLRNLDFLLYKKAQVVAATVQYERQQVNLSNVPYLGDLPLPPNSDVVYARWYSQQGQLEQFFGVASIVPLKDESEFQTLTVEAGLFDSQPVLVRQITLPVQYRGNQIGYLQIAIPLTQMQHDLEQDLLLSLVCILVALIVVAATG